MSRALRDIPAVRALAARDAFDLMQRVRANRGMLSDHAEAAVYEGVLDLLTDLSRPASRDAVARLVAEAVGWPSTPTAPFLGYDTPSPSPRDRDGAPYREDWPERWIFTSSDGNGLEFVAPDDEADEPWFPESWVVVPGLRGSDPAEALALIADAVLT